MSVEFVIGPSGSGKTRACLEAVRERLVDKALGPPLLLLVPEQATFQMEQALLADGSLKGFHRAAVLSFDRLAHLVLQQTVPPRLETLSESAKQLMLRRLLQIHRSDLSVFAASCEHAGFLQQLSGTLSELRQYRVTPDALREQRAQLDGDDPAAGPLGPKLADLALIYQAYLEGLSGRFLDPDDLLDLTVHHCGQARLVQAELLAVDGFAGFTPQQLAVLEQLMCAAQETTIALCFDGCTPAAQAALQGEGPHPCEDLDLFYPVLRTARRLRALVHATGLTLAPPRLLPEAAGKGGAMPRFAHVPELARLEEHLRCGGERVERLRQTDGRCDGIEPGNLPTRGVLVVQAPDRRREVQALAAQILCLCKHGQCRFRDLAVIVRDFEPYQGLLEAVFREHDIPFFLDQRRPIRHHPLAELVRSALSSLTTGFKSEHILRYLKTDLSAIGRSEVDALENYVLAHGIEGSRWLDDKPWPSDLSESREAPGAKEGDSPSSSTSDTSTSGVPTGTVCSSSLFDIDGVRRRAVAPLGQLLQSLYGGQPGLDQALSVREVVVQVVAFLDVLAVNGTLAQWCSDARANNDLDLALSHEQAYAQVLDLFDDLVTALGDTEATLSQVADWLTDALAELTVALVPPAVDQVLVGSVERSRHPDLRGAFILGMNEGAFPRCSAGDAIFTDLQRDMLSQKGLELAADSTQRLLAERYLAYIALTRASHFLWVSFAAADENGNALEPSSFLDAIQACLNPAVLRLPVDEPDDFSGVHTSAQLARRLACHFGQAQHVDDVPASSRQLAHVALQRPDLAAAVRSAFDGALYRNRAQLQGDLLPRLLGSQLCSSVSRLESFAACPFQHFARYILNVQVRPELSLDPVDIGSFYHHALEELFQQMRQRKLDWQGLDEEQLNTLVCATTARLQQQDSELLERHDQSHRNRYLLEQSSDYLHRFCRTLAAAARVGRFEQQFAELAFGRPADHLPPLIIELPEGRQLLLRGKIDRVDICRGDDGSIGLAVIDYKTTSRPFSYERFHYGLTLQLPAYLLVLLRHYQSAQKDSRDPVQPAAALYVPVLRQGQSHTDPPPEDLLNAYAPEGVDVSEESGDGAPPEKAKGLINQNWLDYIDKSAARGTGSLYYAFRLKKDGTPYANSTSVLSGEQMTSLLARCSNLLADLSQRLLDGDIAVSPYRIGDNDAPCCYCDYRPLCRFDFTQDRYRQLPKVDRDDILGNCPHDALDP